MNRDELVARMAQRLNALEQKMLLVERTYPSALQLLQQMAEERDGHITATARTELYAMGLITVLLKNGTLTYEQLTAAMEVLPSTEDYLVLWGVRTEEESLALRAAAEAEAAEAAAAQEASRQQAEEVAGKNEEMLKAPTPSQLSHVAPRLVDNSF